MILVVVMTLWYLFGSSPTMQELLSVIVIGPYIFIFTIYDRVNGKIEKLVYERLNGKIEKLNDKISEIKIQLARIEGKVTKSK